MHLLIVTALLTATPVLAAPKGSGIVNAADFGATPNDAIDDTAAIQAAIDALPSGLVAGSARARRGGIVWLPPGAYRIGGVPGRCTGAAQGTACRDDRPCVGGPVAGSCAALISGGRQLRLMGAGPYGTELLLVGGDDMDGIAISPGDDFSAIEGVRIAKVSRPRVGTGNGIVIQGQRTTVRDVNLDGWGAAGIFIDGAQSLAKANSCRIDRVESNGNGGDGVHIWSHNDGSVHTVTGCDAQDNGGFGFRIRSSKSTLVGLETNGNRGGGILIEGDHNPVSSYFEIANQPTCVPFAREADFNVLFDLSGCTTKPGKLVDLGRDNAVHVDGGWTALGWVPTDAPGPCDAGRRARTYYDDSARRLCVCERGEGGAWRWCPMDGSVCHGTASGCD